jgi:hypothetical protein
VRETKAAREARHDFYRAVLGRGPCWLNTITPHACDGPIDPCHLLSKQKLKRIAKDRGYDEAETLAMVWDERNGVPGCRAYHHRLDNGFMRVYYHQLPGFTHDFIFAYDLEWEMEQVYRKEDQT